MYRKFTADHIFNGNEIVSRPAVLITDESGVIIEIVDPKDAGDGIEMFKGLLTPGFVNAHCHLELSHLKDFIPEKTGLVNFVQQVMRSRPLPNELKGDAMVHAEAAMYQTGIVAVGDICNTTDSMAIKQQSKLLWHNFIEVSGFVNEAAPKRLDDMKKVYEQFLQIQAGQRSSLSPHAPYSVSRRLFQLLNTETANQLITIHNQESAAENELYQYKKGEFLSLYKNFGIDIAAFEPSGTSSFQSWLPRFDNHQSIISVHNTFTGEDDLDFRDSLPVNKRCKLFYCLCINANKYIEQKIPPIGLFIKHRCNLVIGTDSYASNHQLNIMEEIKAIQTETHHTIPLQELLRWATINGANALGQGDVIGSFEIGKKPGIVLIDGLEDLQVTPQSLSRRIL